MDQTGTHWQSRLVTVVIVTIILAVVVGVIFQILEYINFLMK